MKELWAKKPSLLVCKKMYSQLSSTTSMQHFLASYKYCVIFGLHFQTQNIIRNSILIQIINWQNLNSPIPSWTPQEMAERVDKSNDKCDCIYKMKWDQKTEQILADNQQQQFSRWQYFDTSVYGVQVDTLWSLGQTGIVVVSLVCATVQSPPVDSGFGHVTCFRQSDISKCDTSRGLISTCAVVATLSES